MKLIFIIIILMLLSINAYTINLNSDIPVPISVITLLDGVTTTGSSEEFFINQKYHKISIHVIADSIVTGAIGSIESSLDNINYATILTANININGTTALDVIGFTILYVRFNIIEYIDGILTANMMVEN